MTSTEIQLPAARTEGPDGGRADALAERLVAATIGALEMYSVHLGRELGLYPLLAEAPRTAGELAEAAGIAPRYAREWLEQQAVAGILDVVGTGAPADRRRFVLPTGHRPVLVEAEHPAHVGPLADMLAGIGGVVPRLPAAYRSGGGVPYADYGSAFRRGQAGINRPMYVNDLADWVAAMPDVAARLGRPDARVADLGCGEGWSTIALARAFPAARVEGYDSDPASVRAAGRNAADLPNPPGFTAADGLPSGGRYDLVCLFEALHDLARPVEVLTAARAALTPGGVLLVADEAVAEEFCAPGDDVERFMYGWSVTHCLPASLADTPSAGLGTVLRPGTVAALARDAGFTGVTVLPVENDFFRFYRLDR
jgi:SAM-dependent methyltransferase